MSAHLIGHGTRELAAVDITMLASCSLRLRSGCMSQREGSSGRSLAFNVSLCSQIAGNPRSTGFVHGLCRNFGVRDCVASLMNRAEQKITSASGIAVPGVQFLRKVIWQHRKGRLVRRIPAHFSVIGQQHRSQDRPMLSNTSCSALLAPGSSAAASLSSPP